MDMAWLILCWVVGVFFVIWSVASVWEIWDTAVVRKRREATRRAAYDAIREDVSVVMRSAALWSELPEEIRESCERISKGYITRAFSETEFDKQAKRAVHSHIGTCIKDREGQFVDAVVASINRKQIKGE